LVHLTRQTLELLDLQRRAIGRSERADPAQTEAAIDWFGRAYAAALHSLPLFLTLSVMKATLTSKGQITIPASIRRRLGLEPGQILDFDEHAPYLKAVPVIDEEEMRSVLGCATNPLGRGTKQWLDETRGPVELPPETG